MSDPTAAPASVGVVDARGVRFAASVTTFVIALALLAPDPWRWVLIAGQASVFALSAGLGLRNAPYGLLYGRFVRPLLSKPPEFEDAAPPRFAQLVGFLFLGGALLALGAGSEPAALILVGFAFGAAALNAVLGLCLGCELYLLLRRLTPSQS